MTRAGGSSHNAHGHAGNGVDFDGIDLRPKALISVEAEQSVLGGLLLDRAAWAEISTTLRNSDFHRSDHQIIFAALGELARSDKPFDIVLLCEQLNSRDQLEAAGGVAYLGRLARETPTAANIKQYAEIVAKKALLRRLQSVGDDRGRNCRWV